MGRSNNRTSVRQVRLALRTLGMLGLWTLTAQGWSEETQAAVAPGPRGPTGPDVPLTKSEEALFAKRLTVAGRTAAAVQAVCDRAVNEGIKVVFLPAGEYVFEAEVAVPAGLALLGEGTKTAIRTKEKNTRLFSVQGDGVRFTRLKLQGADTTPSVANDTYGIAASGKKNVRVDHCELLGFSHATNFAGEATAQVDHCHIHHNARDGLGYGVVVYSGAYVLVMDNEFEQNRHSFASNGALDWSDLKPGETRRHKPGFRKTHWEFIYNRVGSNDITPWQLGTVDIHPGMDGTFVIEGNLFENMRHATGLMDGSGIIRGNLFRNLKGYQPAAIWIQYGTHNGNPIENAMPHDIRIEKNVFEGNFEDGIVFQKAIHKLPAKYRLGKAENVTIDGKLIEETRVEKKDLPPVIPRLEEMTDAGLQHVRQETEREK